VLGRGAGETNMPIAKRMGLTGMTVGTWHKYYRELGLVGLHDELRNAQPRAYQDAAVAEVINPAAAKRTRFLSIPTDWALEAFVNLV
jgi:transposase